MRAVGFRHSLPIDQDEALIDIELDKPAPQRRDLLVEVKAVSVNPVDTKVRKRTDPKGGAPKVLGYDATGVVAAVGPEATLFKPGDAVWYAGSIVRPGTNSEFHLVDERIVGRKPKTLDFAAAAALPLTSITAWEVLFDRFGIARQGGEGKSLLIIGGAGGVGSIAIQLARTLTRLTVIASASRPRDAKLVPRARRASCDRPCQADARAGEGDRASLRRLHLRRHRIGRAFRRDRRDDRAAGQVRPDRRSEVARRREAEGQERLAALGGDVHPLDLPDRRHGRRSIFCSTRSPTWSTAERSARRSRRTSAGSTRRICAAPTR